MRSFLFCAVALFLFACGGADEIAFPEMEGDWILEGLSCADEIRPRLLTIRPETQEGIESSTSPALLGYYRRGNECVDQGDLAMESLPRREGQSLSLWAHREESKREFEVRIEDHNVLRLKSNPPGTDLLLRKVYEEANPPARFPESTRLAGQWWMEGYPCLPEGTRPQIVEILHVPPTLSMRKVVGDDCIPEGSFFDGSLSGHEIDGKAYLLPRDFAGWPGEDEFIENEPVEAYGDLRNDDFFALRVATYQVRFRRIY